MPARDLTHVFARMARMTSSSPPYVALANPTPVTGDQPPGGGLDVPCHLAICHRCDPDLAQPFLDVDDRDAWACRHLADTGHTVMLTIQAPDTDDQHESAMAADLHLAVLLRVDDDGNGYRWLCPSKLCERWRGPYTTPQVALASWAAHSAKAAIVPSGVELLPQVTR